MRRFVTAALSLSLGFSVLLSVGQTASANAIAGGGYSSSYAGESVFTNKAAGESGQFSVIFFNDGTQSWAPGTVGLLVCLSDKTTCNVASPLAAYASGWYSSTVYATVSATVAPGQNGFFIYNFVVPAGTAAGTSATFNGDVGLIATGAELRPEGYFQTNTTPGGTTTGMTLSPATAALAVGGQQQFTLTGAPAGTTVTWNVTGGCGAVTNNGLFAATSTNSPTQPCNVVATAGGSTASAAITVFGPATSIRCATTPASVPADAATTAGITGTLIDANGNVVANDNSTVITFTNNTPTLLSARGNTPDQDSVTAQFQRIAQSGISTSNYLASTTGASGTGVISLSSGTLTGCTQQVTITGPGPAAKTASSFYLGTITAEGTSKSTLEVDVTDANGVIVSTDQSTTITISRTSGSASCTPGSAGPSTVTNGTVYFTITSTTTPGTCTYEASASTTGVTSSSATLTTVLAGAPSKLAIAGNASPRAADGVATLRVTVALQDANGNAVTTPSAQKTVTANVTSGSGCTGTKADGSAGAVTFSDGTTANKTAATGSYSAYGLSETTNYARFVFISNFATAGCTVTFSDGSDVTSTTAVIVFTAGGPADVACKFTPRFLLSDGSSTSIGTVSLVDGQNNLASSGTYSVSFSGTGGNTTQLTASPQSTSSGIAQFTVRSTSATANGTDTYTASTTVAGTSQSGTCSIGTYDTLPEGP